MNTFAEALEDVEGGGVVRAVSLIHLEPGRLFGGQRTFQERLPSRRTKRTDHFQEDGAYVLFFWRERRGGLEALQQLIVELGYGAQGAKDALEVRHIEEVLLFPLQGFHVQLRRA